MFQFLIYDLNWISIYSIVQTYQKKVDRPTMQQNQNNGQKKSYQFKALMRKNIRLQSRQPCTNCCQIFTPIICLLFTIMIRDVVIDKLPDNEDNIFSKAPLIPIKFNNFTLFDAFLPKNITRNCTQWYLFDVDKQSDEDFVGVRDGMQGLSGMLGSISDTYYKQCKYNFSRTASKPEKLHPPVFKRPKQDINRDIFDVQEFLNSANRSIFTKYNLLSQVPDGAITFHNANRSSLEMTLQINDLKNLDYHQKDGITRISYFSEFANTSTTMFTIPEGLLSLQDLASSSYLKSISQSQTMQSGLMYMPPHTSAPVTADLLINTVSQILFPLSLSLLMPVFLYLLVLQKQEKLIQMMRMNGMKMRNYWAVNFLFDFIIGLLTNIVFYLFGWIFLGGGVFDGTGMDVVFVIQLGWILDQIALATFFQVFISSSRAANIIGYLLSIWTNLIGSTLSLALFQFPRKQPFYFTMFPTFAFDRLFYLMLTKCTGDSCYKSLSSLDQEAKTCIIVLYVSFFIFQLLGMYLFEIIPQQFGVSQKITFPLDMVINKFRGQNLREVQFSQIIEQQNNQEGQLSKPNHDQLAKREINKISQIGSPNEYALICSNLRKVYENGKQAVKSMNLAVSDKEVFGLLGPNGAGKTTLISMITGIFSPSSGDCFVAGKSIREDIQKVHVNIGVCPQFDILWPQLTVQEHLYFYARLRGISADKEEQAVKKALLEVSLDSFRNFYANQLSGGMKRRLSVGISMVGNPRIVFLDQPTTGLDPENRRNLWEVLNKCKAQRSLFLTTHLMEEADTLCHRVGVITDGVLRTVGTQQQLKKRYGKGYCLSLNIEADMQNSLKHVKKNMSQAPQIQYQQLIDQSIVHNQSILTEQPERQVYAEKIRRNKQRLQQKVSKIKQQIKSLFPFAQLDREINGFVRFVLGDVTLSKTMQLLNNSEIDEIRENWALSNSSLEDVFLSVVYKFESQTSADETIQKIDM